MPTRVAERYRRLRSATRYLLTVPQALREANHQADPAAQATRPRGSDQGRFAEECCSNPSRNGRTAAAALARPTHSEAIFPPTESIGRFRWFFNAISYDTRTGARMIQDQQQVIEIVDEEEMEIVELSPADLQWIGGGGGN